MALKCDSCSDEPVYRITHQDGQWLCDKCRQFEQVSNCNIGEKVFISKSYGFESKARVEELNKRVILPIERKDGKDYYVGRKDGGRIHERTVDIRP